MESVSEPAAARTGGKSAVDTVLDKISAMISQDGLRAGDPLPTETEIAQRFSTSRNTVREAISVLRAYGVVESRQRVGPVLVDNRHIAISKLFSFSHQVSPDAFNDIQGFRRLIEMGIVDALLENRTEEDLQTLHSHNEAMKGAADVTEAARFDYLFHLQLVQITGNTTTVDVYRFLEPVIRRLLEGGKARKVSRVDIGAEHQKLIEMIDARDRYGYLHHIDQHLRSGLKFLV